MKLFGIFCRSVFALFLLSLICLFQNDIERHLEIGSQNLSKVSETFKSVDQQVRKLDKEYNEYLSSAFR